MNRKTDYLSLPAAILMNINIIIGAGVFINTVPLAQKAGSCSAFSYALVGIIMFPLICAIAQLLYIFPRGGFYAYAAQTMHPVAGFISAWSYFTGKLASCALAIHIFVLFIQRICPFLQPFPPFLLDAAIIAFFFYLNTYNVKTAGRVQMVLFAVKMMPLAFVILIGPTLFCADNIVSHCTWNELPGTIPLVFFALLGFEACCSVSSHITNAQKNAARAVIISYGFVIALYVAYQFLFYAALGDTFNTLSDYRSAFPALIGRFMPVSHWAPYIEAVLHCAIASSALSAGYGILFSNMWNLHTLAQNGHVACSRIFSTLNAYNIPIACLAVEALLCLVYIAITGGHQTSLQYTSVLGSTVAYTLSAFGLFAYHKHSHSHLYTWTSIGAVMSCMLLLSLCMYNIITTNLTPLMLLGTLMAAGMCMFLYTHKKKNQ
jgi:amino acid transporter